MHQLSASAFIESQMTQEIYDLRAGLAFMLKMKSTQRYIFY